MRKHYFLVFTMLFLLSACTKTSEQISDSSEAMIEEDFSSEETSTNYITEEITTESFSTEEIITEESTTEEMITEESTTEEMITEESITEAPSTEAPTTAAPSTEVPTTVAPSTEVPSTVAPSTEAPTTVAPSTEAPTTVAPSTVAPSTEAPSTEAPSTEAPSTVAPSTEAPSTEAPSTEAPSTVAPSTEAPSTEAPSTEAPSTVAPSTEAPSTEVPSTEAPKSEDDVIYVSYEPIILNNGVTYTGLPSLPAITYSVKDPNNIRGLSTEPRKHSFGVANYGGTPSYTIESQTRFDSLRVNAMMYDGKSQEKVLYLTFNGGYAYGTLTEQILDTLREKNVHGTFFLTFSYLKNAPKLVTRMIAEGHIVGNHSTSHPSEPALLSRAEMAQEVLGVHNFLRANFGYECKYFRFPSGFYSDNALELVSSLNYRISFWSCAYADWSPDNQLGIEVSFETLISRIHPGAVIQLHTTSPDSTANLARFIDYAREQGYEFRSLNDYAWEH